MGPSFFVSGLDVSGASRLLVENTSLIPAGEDVTLRVRDAQARLVASTIGGMELFSTGNGVIRLVDVGVGGRTGPP